MEKAIIGLTLPLDTMTTAEKLRALEAIWDDLCRTPEDVPAPPWHADELREREKRVQEGSSRFVEFHEAKRIIREECELESPAWHEAVLADRAAALASGEEVCLDWEEAKERIRNECL